MGPIKFCIYLLHEQLANCWDINQLLIHSTDLKGQGEMVNMVRKSLEKNLPYEKYASQKKRKCNGHYTWQTVIICIILFTATVDPHPIYVRSDESS